MSQRWRSFITSTIVALLLLIPGGYAIIHQQQLSDWWHLRNYVAPTAVASLATDTTMNDQTRRIFYVNHPVIQDKVSFYSSCSEDEQTVVLGCYINNRGIFVLGVDDQRLNGVEQVTAAHELLHAAYDRLNDADKRHIDQLVQDTYAKLNDADITQKIVLYKLNNADIPNELHSILGTEVAKLPPELETYYQRYFTDRSKIVGYANTYKGVFTQRKQQFDAYNQQLKDLEAQITANNTTLDAKSGALETEKARLDSLKASGNIDEYNAGVNPFNANVATYNKLVAQNKQLIATYKTTLAARNQVADEAQALSKALDSRISTRDAK